MVVSFSTNSLTPGRIAPKSKPLLLQPLHLLLSSTRSSKSSTIRALFSANRIPHRHLSRSSTPGSDATVLEDQSRCQTREQAQSEEEEADSSSEVASELNQTLGGRKERERQGGNLLIGVKQEVREQQWSDLVKMAGTTGVVLAVIAGSTAALLSVNAILAELSDKMFDGRIKIQDFF